MIDNDEPEVRSGTGPERQRQAEHLAALLSNTDGERDYAEEAAVRAEQNAERTSEQQHLDRQANLVEALQSLAFDAHRDAIESVRRLRDEVMLRLAPNSHRYELLARQQHVALLAAATANAVEETPAYDLLRVAQTTVANYRASHHGPGGFATVFGLADAAQRVLDTVRESLQ